MSEACSLHVIPGRPRRCTIDLRLEPQNFPHAQISEEFNVAVVITNQVLSDPSGGAMFVSDPKKPVRLHSCHNSQ